MPQSTSPPKLSARSVSLAYYSARTKSETNALDGVNLDVYPGEFVSIVGPSGCGKTTFLKATDGLLSLTNGSIILDGQIVTKPGSDRAMVFQSPCLLPWRTALGNVLYGMELQDVPRNVRLERARSALELVGLKDFANHFPHELSGGMQQRVNLARALSIQPQMLLLDEPFSALDAQTREFMQVELLRIWESTRLTALFITHQIDEAIFLSDRVIVFTGRPGRVRTEIRIEIPRPRTLKVKRTPEFLAYVDEIWTLIEEQQPGTTL